MAEKEMNWAHKIDQSDNDAIRSTGEQFAIDFLNKNRSVLPSDRFALLVNQTIEILRKREVQEKDIQIECAKLLNKLRTDAPKKEWKFADLGTALSRGVSNVAARTDRFISTDEKIILYRNGWDEAVSIKDFEKELTTKSLVEMNSLGLANYFIYLKEKNLLTQGKLEQVFGSGSKWKGKLLDMAVLWGIEDPNNSKSNNSTIAQKHLTGNPAVLSDMQKILSKELQEFLVGDKNKNIKDALQKRFWDKFNEREFEVLKKWDVIELRTLLEYIKKISGENFKNLAELKSILVARQDDIGDEKKRIDMESKLANAYISDKNSISQILSSKKLTFSGIPNKLNNIPLSQLTSEDRKTLVTILKRELPGVPPEQLELLKKLIRKLELPDRKKRIEKQEVEAKKVISMITKVNKGTISRKDFDTYMDKAEWEKPDVGTISSRVKKWETEEKIHPSSKVAEEGDTKDVQKTPLSMRGLSRESLASMPIGSRKTLSLSDETTIDIRKMWGNQYTLKIGNQNEMKLLGSEIRGYVWSYKLLQSTGLESMINMEPNKLSQVIASCSKNGNRIDNTDGSFWKDERMHFLKAMATACWVGESIAHEYNIHTMKDKFKEVLTHKGGGSPKEWFRLLAQENNFMTKESPYTIISDTLIQKIKHKA